MRFLRRLGEAFSNWILGDQRRRVEDLRASLDKLEERYIDIRADVFRKRTRR